VKALIIFAEIIFMIRAEIINIGNELLHGMVVNANGSFLAKGFSSAGIRVEKITAVADEKEAVEAALTDALSRSDYIVTTGGLGPTSDDVTKEIICDYFCCGLREEPAVLEHIKNLFGARALQLDPTNVLQAHIPEVAKPMHNALGTAPGLWIERDGRVLACLPGVPFEMENIAREIMFPMIYRRSGMHPLPAVTVLTSGIGESALARLLEPWEKSLPPALKLAYLPEPGIVKLRISSEIEGDAAVNHALEALKARIPHLIFGYNDDTPEAVLGNLLRAKKMSFAVAESCTGGYLSHLITSVAGSSEYFKGGVIAYSNEAKTSRLGVDAALIMKHGAVSSEVALAMAEGARALFGTDCSAGITGIAGPGGATPEKPVGTVWIAVCTPSASYVGHHLLGDHRQRNIRRAAVRAIDMLLKKL
jgi:nicotinamide-nucleotide amidase